MDAVGRLIFFGLINVYIYNYRIIIDMGTPAEPFDKTSSNNTCNLCGITFANNDEKEEHMKLEHSEHKQPSGVS